MMEPIQIMLVDSDEKALTETHSSLQSYNVHHKLCHARNGNDALALLNKKYSINDKPVLLLISNELPDMKGQDLVERIRQKQEWKQPRCFILINADYASDPFLYRHLDISGFVSKPLKLNSPSGMGELNLAVDLMSYRMLHGI
ncbi:MAG: response regulator [Sediminibacterium sp.]